MAILMGEIVVFFPAFSGASVLRRFRPKVLSAVTIAGSTGVLSCFAWRTAAGVLTPEPSGGVVSAGGTEVTGVAAESLPPHPDRAAAIDKAPARAGTAQARLRCDIDSSL